MKTYYKLPRVFLLVLIACDYLAPCLGLATTPPVGEKLVPWSWIYRSWVDYRETVTLDAPRNYTGQKITSVEIEIRKMDENARLARLKPDIKDWPAYYGDVFAQPHFEERLSNEQLLLLADSKPGEYQIALNINGVRASNVVSVRIDPTWESRKAPVLTLGVIEPHPLGPARNDFVMWVVTPTPAPSLELFGIYPLNWTVIVDGIERKKTSLSPPIVGPRSGGRLAGVTESGTQLHFPINLYDGYTQNIDDTQVHVYKIGRGPYESVPTTVSPADNSLNSQWDSATSILKDLVPSINAVHAQAADSPATSDGIKSSAIPLPVGEVVVAKNVFIDRLVPAGVAKLPIVTTSLLRFKNMSLAAAIESLADAIKDSNYIFVVSPDVDKAHRDAPLTFEFRNCTVEATLLILCENQGLSYEVQGKLVYIHQNMNLDPLLKNVLSTANGK